MCFVFIRKLNSCNKIFDIICKLENDAEIKAYIEY